MITIAEIVQLVFYAVVLLLLTPPLGKLMAKIFEGEKTFLSPVVGWLERLTYKLSGIDPNEEMNWKTYMWAMLAFNFFGFTVVFLLQFFQSHLPLNPQQLADVSWHLAFNTAVSFMTNTNWQSYAGEVTLSYFVQMIGLTVQNFVSAATGIAIMLALVRGIARKTTTDIGNFWTDLVRSTVYVLLPLSILFTIVLVSEGTVQTFSGYQTITTLEGAQQTIPLGPAASQVAIKQLGSNGGGFFNMNSAYPYENPTPLTNFLEMLSLLLLASALVYTFGIMAKAKRHAWVVWGVMFFMFASGLTVSLWSEYTTNPVTGVAGGMEGKETRFGVANSILWSVATTDASNGSVNAMHDSMSPLSGAVAMINMKLGEIIFGGVGAGMYGMMIFILLTVFIAGLMVGRTPEYLGKKIESFEVRMAAIAMLLPSVGILIFTAIACISEAGLAGLNNQGPHGFSEILYAFASTAGNNGSAFAGLTASTPFYDTLLGINMLIGRFGVIIPMLAIAGSLAKKKITPFSSGTFPTDTFLFGLLLLGTILIVGALTFFPTQVLGPIVEHFLMLNGQVF
ncbi:MAG: potassium-transporting ATPase subunit KdpA [Bacteroidetes bacterium]|nr:potassium-transporting ATPase subunit KdpA [Bacteroidota bacterium]